MNNRKRESLFGSAIEGFGYMACRRRRNVYKVTIGRDEAPMQRNTNRKLTRIHAAPRLHLEGRIRGRGMTARAAGVDANAAFRAWPVTPLRLTDADRTTISSRTVRSIIYSASPCAPPRLRFSVSLQSATPYRIP